MVWVGVRYEVPGACSPKTSASTYKRCKSAGTRGGGSLESRGMVGVGRGREERGARCGAGVVGAVGLRPFVNWRGVPRRVGWRRGHLVLGPAALALRRCKGSVSGEGGLDCALGRRCGGGGGSDGVASARVLGAGVAGVPFDRSCAPRARRAGGCAMGPACASARWPACQLAGTDAALGCARVDFWWGRWSRGLVRRGVS